MVDKSERVQRAGAGRPGQKRWGNHRVCGLRTVRVILLLGLLASLTAAELQTSATEGGPWSTFLVVLAEQPLHALVQPVGEPYRAQLADLGEQARLVIGERGTEASQQLADLSTAADATLHAMRQAILDAAAPALLESQVPLIHAVESAGGKLLYRYRIVNVIAVQLPAGALADLDARPDVAAIYPDRQIAANLDISTAAIRADAWWGGETGGIWDVGVIDSGLDRYHPAFSGRTIVEGRFLAAAGNPLSDPSPDDVNGHGSHVAGIISSGDSDYLGVAYGQEKLFNLKAGYDADGVDGGQAFMYWSDAMAAVDWALGQVAPPPGGAGDSPDVLNLSYGGCADSGDSGFNRFWDAVVDEMGTAAAISAGNSGSTCIHYPSIAYNVLSIANVDDRNTPDRSGDLIALTSSWGPSPDGRRKPDLAAPGTAIFSANNNWEGVSWVALTGTSQAAPHVAGASLLALDGGLYTPYAQKALLINTAEDRGPAGWDASWGWGYLDLEHAYQRRLDVHQQVIDPAPDYHLYLGPFSAGDTATLVWNRHVDYAGAVFPVGAYGLNDLDLTLYNMADNNLEDDSLSPIDNVEQVEADSTFTGVLRVGATSSTFNGVLSESYALATEEGFSRAEGPDLVTGGGRTFFLEPGEEVTFTLPVSNRGDLTLHAVEIALDIPAGVLLMGGVNPTALGNMPAGASDSVTWIFRKTADRLVLPVALTVSGEGYGSDFTDEVMVRLVKPPDVFFPLVMR